MHSKTHPFKAFEFLEYSADPATCRDDDLFVKRDAFWSYCGPLFHQDTPPDFHEWSATALSGPILPLLLPLLEFANDLVSQRGLDHYWLTLRATRSTAEYDKPRWHTDDLFFSPGGGSGGLRARPAEETSRRKSLDLQTDWKLCATLLGPSTMFIPLEKQDEARERQRLAKQSCSTDHACTSVRCVGCAAAADAVRDTLAATLAGLGAVQAATGECAFFRIGHDEGAVHSEPCMINSRGRVFVNIVPGRREELRTLVSRWGMSFPRSWWVSPSIPRPLNETKA